MKLATIPLYKEEPYQLETINVAAQPLPKAKAIRKVPLAEFCAEVAIQRKITTFQFTENIHVMPELREQIGGRYIIPSKGINLHPEVAQNLVVCESNHSCGKMLYTTMPFVKGRPICIYSGEAVFTPINTLDFSDDYVFQVKQSDLVIPPDHMISISANRKGGFAGFMQDLLDPITAFTREGDVAVANVIGLPFFTHGVGNVLFVALYNIQSKRQLGYPYGTPYWKTFSQDKVVKKEIFNNSGDIVPGVLLDEKLPKIRLLKSIIKSCQQQPVSRKNSSTQLLNPKIRLAIFLSVMSFEILDALSDEEREILSRSAPSIEDIPTENHYSHYFPDYDCYDRQYLNSELVEAGKKSSITAIHYMKTLQESKRNFPDKEEMEKKSTVACAKAARFFKANEFTQALQCWTQTEQFHAKLYQQCGVIYHNKRPIPLHPESVKLYWNIGNAFLKSGQYLDAFSALGLAHHLQQYLDEPALTNKSLEDMNDRVNEAFNALRNDCFGEVGKKLQPK